MFLNVGFVGIILAGTDDDDDEEMGDAAVEEIAADDGEDDDGFGVTPKPSTRFIMNDDEDTRSAIVNMSVCKLMISFVMFVCLFVGTILQECVAVVARMKL